MNKTKISKIIIFIITFALIVCISTNVFADEPKLDLGDGTGDSVGDDVLNFDEEVPGAETPSEDETPAVEEKPTVEETPSTEDKNTSTYEESDIPYAGPVEDALMIIAFIAFAIVGIYTFKKLSDYSNI